MEKNQSLRCLINKWFGPVRECGIRLKRSGLGRSYNARCVRVVAIVAGRELAIFFFRHDDGSWSVSPPPNGKRAVWESAV
ncbi:MAG: hypothetical protein EPN73_22710 [Paraburkholderia sp.]|uniref:hypothetical protein n=1 Tax=Paraburkholderia sp. TaxID=1926495 RepID=UPI0011F5590C|nr:hypothetical protein [Paraburkholderia sp.]TAL93182.1 MAG: hypothetical protein EPN73_22710 [Paraburkholderia sp.]